MWTGWEGIGLACGIGGKASAVIEVSRDEEETKNTWRLLRNLKLSALGSTEVISDHFKKTQPFLIN